MWHTQGCRAASVSPDFGCGVWFRFGRLDQTPPLHRSRLYLLSLPVLDFLAYRMLKEQPVDESSMGFWAWCIAVQDGFGVALDFQINLYNPGLSPVSFLHTNTLLASY